MPNFWLLPFTLIGFWIAVGIVEWIRTPKTAETFNNDLNKRPLSK